MAIQNLENIIEKAVKDGLTDKLVIVNTKKTFSAVTYDFFITVFFLPCEECSSTLLS